MVMSLPQLYVRHSVAYCIVRWRSPLARAFSGAILCLVGAVLLRSAPYPYWHWQGQGQGGQISKLLDRIRGGDAEKYTTSVANCPGLFVPSSHPFPEGKIAIESVLAL
jgi:hypothetical protein